MRCSRCKKVEATVHVTTLTDGSHSVKDFCQSCMNNEGIPLLSRTSKSALRCPRCGISLREIQMKGRFGCQDDYEVFKDSVIEALEQYHGHTEHRGKVPEIDFF